jgi:putative FmdB family regulatory protein
MALKPPGGLSIIDLQEVAMPMYDYRCQECGKRSSIYQSYEDYGQKPVECPHCGSLNLERRIQRVRFARSEESRLDALGDPSDWGDLDESDPRAMAHMMRKMSSELGEEMPPEFDEVVDRLEAGESPEDIESSLPDLGAGDDV